MPDYSKHEDEEMFVKKSMSRKDETVEYGDTVKMKGDCKMHSDSEMLAAQLAAQRNNDNDGLGGGLVTGLLLGSLTRGGMFGGGYGYGDGYGRDGGRGCCGNKCCEKMIDMHDHHDDHNHEVDEIHGVQMEVCAAERQVADVAMMLQKCCCDTDKDVLEAKYDVGSQVQETKYAGALNTKDIIREIDLQTCKVEKDVLENKYELSKQIFEGDCKIQKDIAGVNFNQMVISKDAAMQLDQCCCKLENKIRDSIDATNNCCCETQKLMLQIDAKNDMKEADRERRALERQIDNLVADKRQRDNNDTQNVLNNFGTITDSLNKVITALGNTTAA